MAVARGVGGAKVTCLVRGSPVGLEQKAKRSGMRCKKSCCPVTYSLVKISMLLDTIKQMYKSKIDSENSRTQKVKIFKVPRIGEFLSKKMVNVLVLKFTIIF